MDRWPGHQGLCIVTANRSMVIITYCNRCGMTNADGVNFCATCGNPLGQTVAAAPAGQPSPIPRQAMLNDPRKRLMIIAAIVVAVLVVVAIVAVVLLTAHHSTAQLKISDSSYTPTAAFGAAVFTVTVENTGSTSASGTIHCKITFSNGDSYSASQDITLDGGASSTYYVTVTTSLTHLLDSSADYTCTL